jgi:uncharacterized protein YuzE
MRSFMKIRHFTDTDTLWIELRPPPTVETRDVDDQTRVEGDAAGSVCAITLEHALQRTDPSSFDFERVTA